MELSLSNGIDYRSSMKVSWEELIKKFNGIFRERSTRRKLLQIISIVLIFEGLSVFVLYSKVGLLVGIFSLALGAFLLLLLHPGPRKEPEPAQKEQEEVPPEPPPGIKLIDTITNWVDNDYVIMVAGALMIASDVTWNLFFSARPGFGDLDTLMIMFGGLVIVYPLLVDRFKFEAAFCLLFVGLVVLFLVIPQAVTLIHAKTGSSIGNSYVQYMLAAPFSGILNLIGIHSSSAGSIVVIQLVDGKTLALEISAYCAGLYSFSIFLAAFFSFVLMFERLKTRVLVLVLATGLLVAFLGNVFRMVIIGVVGYYWGYDALIWAHHNAGWVIFLSWSAVFWYLLLGYVSKHSARGASAN